MSDAVILDGVAAARALREETARRASALAARGVQPALAVIVVGDDPASAVYVRNKVRACADAGLRSERIDLPGNATEESVLARLRALNEDPSIHGILVQLPLPPHIEVARVIAAIAPEKDVDGFHPDNLGALVSGRPLFAPCTPSGIVSLLDRHAIALEGRHAVVVGRSNIVGKPLSLMLLARGATVTTCHSRTRDLADFTRRADVLVVAAGRPRLVTGDMVRPGAVVVDVGIHRLADGRLAGDVDFESARRVAGYITPVPGGVGPMTVAALIASTVSAAEAASTGALRAAANF